MLRLLVFMILCSVPQRDLEAQALNGIVPNARIRVETTNGNLEIGRVAVVRGDSLWLRIDRADTVAAYSAAQLRAFEISRGASHWRGARRGALIGGALGLIAVGVSLHADLTTREDVIIPSTVYIAPAALLLTLAGAGLGAVVVEERWGAPATVRIGVGVSGRGVGIAYHVRF